MNYTAAAAAKSLQLCLTLCDSIDGSPPGSSVPGVLQARTLEWVESEVTQSWQLLATAWTAAYQAPLSMGFSREEYWSGVPLPSLEQMNNTWFFSTYGSCFSPAPPASPVVRLRTRDLLRPKGYGDFKLRSWKNCLTYTLDEWDRVSSVLTKLLHQG